MSLQPSFESHRGKWEQQIKLLLCNHTVGAAVRDKLLERMAAVSLSCLQRCWLRSSSSPKISGMEFKSIECESIHRSVLIEFPIDSGPYRLVSTIYD